MAKNLAEQLESLSGYKHLFKAGGPQAHLNPVNYSYLRLRIGGIDHFVLSRIADCGLDYTQRSNKIAHHVVLDASELNPAGPAAIAGQAEYFARGWEGDPRTLPPSRRPTPPDVVASRCTAWEAAMGDAGWGGVLARHAIERPNEPAYVIFPSGTDLLPLFAESQRLMPPTARWTCSFSTYFAITPPGVDCLWRGIAEGTPEAERLRRTPDRLVIDLAQRGPALESSPYTEAARTGTLPQVSSPNQQRPFDEKPAATITPAARGPAEINDNPVEVPTVPAGAPRGWETGAAPPMLPMRPTPVEGHRRLEDELWEPRRRARSSLPLPVLIVAGSILLLLGVAVGAVIVGFPFGPTAEVIDSGEAKATDTKWESSITRSSEEKVAPDNGDVIDRQHSQKDKPSKPEQEDYKSDSQNTASKPLVPKAPDQTPPQPAPQRKLPQTPDRPTPPPGLFDGLRKEVSLPIFSSKVGDKGYLSSVELGDYNGEWGVRPTLLLAPLSNTELRLESIANAKRWNVAAGGGFEHIAEVDLTDGNAKIAWIEGRRKPNLKEEMALRTAFLSLDSDPPGQRFAIALQLPFPEGSALGFSDDLAAVHFAPSSKPNTPLIQIPDQQQLIYTGEVTGLPMPIGPTAFRIVAGGSWELQLDADKNIILVIETRTPKSDFHSLEIDIRLQTSVPKSQKRRKDFDRKFLDERLEARHKSVDAAIRKHEDYHYKSILQKLGRNIDQEVFRSALSRLAGGLAQGTTIAEKERYERWLRLGDWEIRQPSAPKNAPPLYENGKNARAQKQLTWEQENFPIERLEAWNVLADAIPRMEIHIRATRQLRAQDAPGFKVPPYANVFVLGNPPPFDPIPSERD
ncbi:hypothetical protein Pla108_14100 [Botrimarina colliarenosi]|uniref:Uncharacterized protein n=2 Tax=Botrimarina colliarenosi TaxID=2528001 RepID=A0A5C6AMG9_9BACT|nr:hypothetical protein Pla108_14100 [Botrimarina colliarenosi]